MNQRELIDFLTGRCEAVGLAEISPPLYYQGEGPFIFALGKHAGKYQAYLFEVLSPDEFLTAPDAIPRACYEDAFFDMVERHVDLSPLHDTDEHHPLIRYKVVPDDPACRSVLKELCLAETTDAVRIMLVSPDGTWLSCDDLRQMPLWLS